MTDPSDVVRDLMNATAQSLGQSFENYWPSNPEGGNDPCEENIVVHLGHQLLDQGFSVFAEAHCDGGRIDLVAVDVAKSLFLAFEAKRLLCNKPEESLDLMVTDLERLNEFNLKSPTASWLHTQKRSDVVRECREFIGVVAGLVCVVEGSRSKKNLMDFWTAETSVSNKNYFAFNQRLSSANAALLDPILAWKENETSYHLLSIFFGKSINSH